MTVFRPGRSKYYIARWTDPESGRRTQESLKTTRRRKADDKALVIARRVIAEKEPEANEALDQYDWWDFASLYARSALRRRSASHRQSWGTVTKYVDEFGVKCVGSITARWVTRWQLWLADTKGLAPNSVASHSARLRAALKWAFDRDMLAKMPHIDVEPEEVPASRGITLEEFKEILQSVPQVRPDDASYWDRLLRALWQSNLRIGELVQLSWDSDAPIRIDTREMYPVISMAPKSHKSRKRRLQVITRGFWEICCETPLGDRCGLVFGIPNGEGGWMTRKAIIRTIGEIGRQAGVVTNPDKGKTATSHDIGKRSFLPKIDDQLTMPEAHKVMGHGKFDTTTKFYDTRSAQELAAKLWGEEA